MDAATLLEIKRQLEETDKRRQYYFIWRYRNFRKKVWRYSCPDENTQRSSRQDIDNRRSVADRRAVGQAHPGVGEGGALPETEVYGGSSTLVEAACVSLAKKMGYPFGKTVKRFWAFHKPSIAFDLLFQERVGRKIRTANYYERTRYIQIMSDINTNKCWI